MRQTIAIAAGVMALVGATGVEAKGGSGGHTSLATAIRAQQHLLKVDAAIERKAVKAEQKRELQVIRSVAAQEAANVRAAAQAVQLMYGTGAQILFQHGSIVLLRDASGRTVLTNIP